MPFSAPGDLPDPGIEPGCAALQAGSSPSEPTKKPTSDKVTLICILTGTKRPAGDLRRLLTPWADRSGFVFVFFFLVFYFLNFKIFNSYRHDLCP